jgi:hypothetical protein
LVSHIERKTEAEVFKNRALRNNYVPGREEVAGGWKQLLH